MHPPLEFHSICSINSSLSLFLRTKRYPFAARAGFRGATQWKENFSVMEYYPTDLLFPTLYLDPLSLLFQDHFSKVLCQKLGLSPTSHSLFHFAMPFWAGVWEGEIIISLFFRAALCLACERKWKPSLKVSLHIRPPSQLALLSPPQGKVKFPRS